MHNSDSAEDKTKEQKLQDMRQAKVKIQALSPYSFFSFISGLVVILIAWLCWRNSMTSLKADEAAVIYLFISVGTLYYSKKPRNFSGRKLFLRELSILCVITALVLFIFILFK